MNRRERIRRYYETRIHPSRPNHDILDWNSAGTQEARFAILLENVDLRGKSLLDVGSGLGDLLGFLRMRGIAADYTGVDLSEKMVHAARSRHPDGNFICADVFTDGGEGPFARRGFDVVFCSGTFNLDLGNNGRFLPLAVSRLVELARRYVVFNLLHTRSHPGHSRYAHFDPDKVIAAIRPLGWEIRLIDNYLPNDFTIISRNPEFAERADCEAGRSRSSR